MKTERRSFLSSCAGVLVGARALWAEGQRELSPGGQGGPRFPGPGANGPADNPFAPQPDPRAQLKESQKNLRKDADHLLDLAKDLKDEAYKTEQTDVLSLSLIHKAEEVEKVARQIKDLVRAA